MEVKWFSIAMAILVALVWLCGVIILFLGLFMGNIIYIAFSAVVIFGIPYIYEWWKKQ